METKNEQIDRLRFFLLCSFADNPNPETRRLLLTIYKALSRLIEPGNTPIWRIEMVKGKTGRIYYVARSGSGRNRRSIGLGSDEELARKVRDAITENTLPKFFEQ